MQLSVEKLSNVECKLTVIVPSHAIEELYQKKINDFAKNATLKGFRPGKAPLSIIKQRFGNDAHSMALREAIETATKDAITESKLTPVSQLKIEPKKKVSNDEPFEFTISFEIFPEIGTINCEISSVERLHADITDEDVQKVINQLIVQFTEWKSVDRPAQLKDRVIIDYKTIFADKEDVNNEQSDFTLEIGSNVMIPGFEQGLLGATVGEERVLHLNFPDDFYLSERAGKPGEFKIKVKEIFEGNAFDLNQDFILKLGVPSGKEEDLRQKIKQTLELNRDTLIKNHIKNQIFDKLVEQNPLDVPSSFIANEVKHIHDQYYAPNQPHDHEQHSQEEMQRFAEIAKKRVMLGILVMEYAKQHQLKADKSQITNRIENIASAYQNPQEVINWLQSEQHEVANIEAQILEELVSDMILKNTKVIEKSITYDELTRYK